MSASVLLIALLIDHCLGWPTRLYRRIGHPVTWLGKCIERLDAKLNQQTNTTRFKGRLHGLITLLLIAGASGLLGWIMQRVFESSVWLWWLIAVAAWPLIAMRSMKEHVEAVADPLDVQDLPGARHAVSMIVGRNPDALDEAGVARAALEVLLKTPRTGWLRHCFGRWCLGYQGYSYTRVLTR